MKKNIPKMIVIVGPTASGKSDLAVAIARLIGGEVISADSRQVYRGLNIGTGKITTREMCGVPHHLLDVAEPKRQFSVSRFRTLAQRAVRDISMREKVPIVCGGTALYIDSLLGRVSIPSVPPNPTLRRECAGFSTEQLFSRLMKLDPARAETIDAHNPRRLIRAIEIATVLGKVPPLTTSNQEDNSLIIGIKPDMTVLQERINARLAARMKRGMRAEVLRLHREGVSWKRMEELGLEYRYLKRHFSDGMKLAEATLVLESEIYHYAKRQMTWWKRDKSIHWFAEGALTDEMKNLIRDFLGTSGKVELSLPC